MLTKCVPDVLCMCGVGLEIKFCGILLRVFCTKLPQMHVVRHVSDAAQAAATSADKRTNAAGWLPSRSEIVIKYFFYLLECSFWAVAKQIWASYVRLPRDIQQAKLQ